MNTITREFTKERLLKIQTWRETYGPGSNVVLPAEEAEELARIALASFEAEPVAWQWEYRDKIHVTNDQSRAKFVAEDGDVIVQPLYTAQPVSVVPTFDEWLEVRRYKPLGWVKDVMRESYDACRAAMLQGKAEPVSNRDVLPVSEIECDICGYKSTDPDGAHYCCEDNSND